MFTLITKSLSFWSAVAEVAQRPPTPLLTARHSTRRTLHPKRCRRFALPPHSIKSLLLPLLLATTGCDLPRQAAAETETAPRLGLFLADKQLETRNTEVFFPEPEVLGFTGGDGNGITGVFGNAMSNIVKLDDGRWRVYLTKRTYGGKSEDGNFASTEMQSGFIDTDDLANWPDIAGNFRPLVIKGLPEGVCFAQPFCIRRDGRFEVFFWIHGNGMIRYVRAAGDDGIHFEIENLEDPCIFHFADKRVRRDSKADGFLTNRGHLVTIDGEKIDPRDLLKVSNDATTVSLDPVTGLWRMYSVLTLPSADTGERRVDYDNAPLFLRIIHRRDSRDGLNWSPPQIVLAPDTQDRVDLQFYCIQQTGQSHRPFLIVGYYPVIEQTMEVMPAFSLDGERILRPRLHWNLRDRLPDGGGGKWLMLMPAGMIEEENHIYMVVTAYNRNHATRHPPDFYRQQNLILRQDKNRWAGLVPKDAAEPGVLTTGPLLYDAPRIVTDDPKKVRVSLLSVFGGELLANGTLDADGQIRFPNNADREWLGKWARLQVHFNTAVFGLLPPGVTLFYETQ